MTTRNLPTEITDLDTRVTVIEGIGGAGTDLTATSTISSVEIQSSTGTDATLPNASAAQAGVLTAANFTAFNLKQSALSIAAGATVNLLSTNTVRGLVNTGPIKFSQSSNLITGTLGHFIATYPGGAHSLPGLAWTDFTYETPTITSQSGGFSMSGAYVVVPESGIYNITLNGYISIPNSTTRRVLCQVANASISPITTLGNENPAATVDIHVGANSMSQIGGGNGISPRFYVDSITAGPFNVTMYHMICVRVA